MRTLLFSHWMQVQVTNVNVKYQHMQTWLQNTLLLSHSANYVGRAINYHQNMLMNVTKRKKFYEKLFLIILMVIKRAPTLLPQGHRSS